MKNQSKRTAKKTLIEWTEAANSAFEALKELCTSTPILAYPDYQLPFILHTDSSSEGLGAVLYQKQEGKLKVITYASRSVSKTKANYPAHKLEFPALKWAVCEKFHEYLYGAKTFDIYVMPQQSWGDRSDTKHSQCLLLGGRWLNLLTIIPKPKGSGGARAAMAQIGPANKRNETKRCLPVEASLRPGEAVPW